MHGKYILNKLLRREYLGTYGSDNKIILSLAFLRLHKDNASSTPDLTLVRNIVTEKKPRK